MLLPSYHSGAIRGEGRIGRHYAIAAARLITLHRLHEEPLISLLQQGTTRPTNQYRNSHLPRTDLTEFTCHLPTGSNEIVRPQQRRQTSFPDLGPGLRMVFGNKVLVTPSVYKIDVIPRCRNCWYIFSRLIILIHSSTLATL